MLDIDCCYRDRFEWPVSAVKPRSIVRTSLAQKLDEFEHLELSPEDQGYLRLARLILELGSELDVQQGVQSQSSAKWDEGLIS